MMITSTLSQTDYDELIRKQKNKSSFKENLKFSLLPKPSGVKSGIEPYTGTWGRKEAAHLLRRCTFGARAEDIATFSALSMSAAVEALLQPESLPNPPLNVSDEDPVGVGNTWVNAAYNPEFEGNRRVSLVSWWTGQMINQNTSLREKMTLFWHNHFATEMNIIGDSRFSYRYINTLRSNALGSFKTLAELITLDPAMLVYLNGNDNVVGSPNENYARELFELFTIGKGEQVAEGDYSTYTEQDVIAAARVLTGWVARRNQIDSVFVPARHDTGNKQFSHRFDNQVISDNGANEYKDLIEMIFAKVDTAKFICRKLYRWFVYYVIDEEVEQNVITPLANLLVANNYEIAPVLATLFKSQHFYDLLQVGCLIKNPMDFSVGLLRQFAVSLPTDLVQQYDAWFLFYYYNGILEMLLADPPQVAGWAAYYQAPQYHEIWINSVTLPARKQLTDGIGVGFNYNGFPLKIDAIAFAEATSNPADCNVLIDEFVERLFPFAVTANQRDFLKEVLRPGIPDLAWTFEWQAFADDPSDPDKRAAIDQKIRILLITMMAMAEYHLS